MISVRRSVTGASVAVGMIAVLAVVMLPLRAHLAVSTPGLVLVIPVVLGTIIGGLTAGLVAVVVGSVVYDLVFIPPYGTLAVAHAQYWFTVAVYAVVMVIVVRLVNALDRARADALMHGTEATRLFELSELLVEDRSVAELVETIVVTVRSVFGTRGVALLLPVEDRLEVVAASGEPFPESELRALSPSSALPVGLGTNMEGGDDEPRAVALITPGGPVGLLVLHNAPGRVTTASC